MRDSPCRGALGDYVPYRKSIIYAKSIWQNTTFYGIIPPYNIYAFKDRELTMKTVLVVDDSAVMRHMVKRTLVENGFKVIGEASNGRIGVKKYKELMPDIVSMDVTMDEMGGIEALSKIMGINPDAKVVMVSSIGQEMVVKDAHMLGAKGFILKPFDEKTMIEVFGNL